MTKSRTMRLSRNILTEEELSEEALEGIAGREKKSKGGQRMTENMQKFLSHLEKDELFQKELEQCAKNQRLERRQLAIAYAARKGISLTEADFASMEQPLSEEELEATAGGSVPTALYDSERRAKGEPPPFF